MSQAGIVDVEGSHPQIPTSFVTNVGTAVPIANTLEILGTVVAAHSIPLETTGSGNTVTVEVQYASAAASSVGTNAGVASFNSNAFTVDANGFVSLVGGGVAIQTINGDVGSITGSTVTIWTNQASGANAGYTVKFINSGTTSTLNFTDVNSNTTLGSNAGNGTMGTNNTFLGIGAGSTSTGSHNIAIGSSTMHLSGAGNSNVAIGDSIMNGLGNGGNNVIVGHNSGSTLQGASNVLIGQGVGSAGTLTGSSNVMIGQSAGTAYTSSESGNILLGASVAGTVGESNVTRIGNAGNQTACYIDGITGITVTGSAPVAVNSSGRLSSLGFGTSGQVLTSNSSPNSPTWQAAPFTAMTYTDEATSFAVVANNGYFVTGAATATLPASPAQGNIANFVIDASVALTITANTGQKIRLGAAVSASAGTCVSSTQGNSISLVYRVSDTTWLALSSIGTWTIT